jgi:hypothetical protein
MVPQVSLNVGKEIRRFGTTYRVIFKGKEISILSSRVTK